jgi:hypothetical protein
MNKCLGNRYDGRAKARIGETHGRLTITGIERRGKGKYLMVCACACGGATTTAHCKLANGHTQSCGCIHKEVVAAALSKRRSTETADGFAKSKIGESYGRLTIIGIERMRTQNNKWHYRMRCKCECGNETVTCHSYLRNGNTNSCGCLLREKASIMGAKNSTSSATKATLRFGWAFNGVKMRSGYEVMFAKALHQRDTEFHYEPKCFVLGPSTRYTPDFYVPSEDCYYEIKGHMTASAQAKIDALRLLGINLKLLFLDQIQALLGQTYRAFQMQWCREHSLHCSLK